MPLPLWLFLLSPCEIQKFYLDYPLKLPSVWNLSRKHFRVSLSEGRFVKLNRFENRLNVHDLKFYCWKLKPMHVYFSVLNWLFPERVGKKYKVRYCVPPNGEFVIDVDAYLSIAFSIPVENDKTAFHFLNACQSSLYYLEVSSIIKL